VQVRAALGSARSRRFGNTASMRRGDKDLRVSSATQSEVHSNESRFFCELLNYQFRSLKKYPLNYLGIRNTPHLKKLLKLGNKLDKTSDMHLR